MTIFCYAKLKNKFKHAQTRIELFFFFFVFNFYLIRFSFVFVVAFAAAAFIAHCRVFFFLSRYFSSLFCRAVRLSARCCDRAEAKQRRQQRAPL